MSPSFPGFLFDIPRNPVVAVGLPLTLGFLSGARTKKVINGAWYQVRASSSLTLSTSKVNGEENKNVSRAFRSLLDDHLEPHSRSSGPRCMLRWGTLLTWQCVTTIAPFCLSQSKGTTGHLPPPIPLPDTLMESDLRPTLQGNRPQRTQVVLCTVGSEPRVEPDFLYREECESLRVEARLRRTVLKHLLIF